MYVSSIGSTNKTTSGVHKKYKNKFKLYSLLMYFTIYTMYCIYVIVFSLSLGFLYILLLHTHKYIVYYILHSTHAISAVLRNASNIYILVGLFGAVVLIHLQLSVLRQLSQLQSEASSSVNLNSFVLTQTTCPSLLAAAAVSSLQWHFGYKRKTHMAHIFFFFSL